MDIDYGLTVPFSYGNRCTNFDSQTVISLPKIDALSNGAELLSKFLQEK
jgi:hypothetical protein